MALIVAVTRGVIEPGVIDGASHARLQVDGLSGNLLGCELARVRDPASGVALYRALLPPGLEVLGFSNSAGVLDPLDYLGHCYEVYVIVARKNFVNPVQESF